MLLHIDQLHEPQDLVWDFDGAQCDLPADIGTISGPVHVEVHVRRVKEEIAIEGRIATHVEMLCSRCLKPHEETLDEAFTVIYLPQPDAPENVDEIELEAADLNVSYYQGETIELIELVRDQVLLLLPVKPLCQPECAGLCPSCGQDLNQGSCDCVNDSIDPRLAVLQQLLHSHTSEE